jgi:hypothetical protein
MHPTLTIAPRALSLTSPTAAECGEEEEELNQKNEPTFDRVIRLHVTHLHTNAPTHQRTNTHRDHPACYTSPLPVHCLCKR